LDQYKKTNMFANNWDEFDESRDVLVDLIDEYRAAESKDYVSYTAPKSSMEDDRAHQR